MTLKRTILAAAFALALPAAALAHGSMIPMHGGQVAVDGEIQIEAVSTPAGLEVYVTEEGLDVPVADLTGRASIQTGSAAPTELEPVESSHLLAPGLVPTEGDAVLVMVVSRISGLRSFATFQY